MVFHHHRKAKVASLAIAASFAALLSFSPSANAQVVAANPQQLPAGDQPGRIEKRFEQPVLPQSLPEPVVPTEKQLPPAESDKVHFVLAGVVFEGNTVISSVDLSELAKDLMGKDVTLTQVYKLAEAVTTKYRNAGYILSTAIVPPQHITGGVVHIRIVEGFVHNVRIEGDANGRADLFREWGERIKESKPFDVKVLERYSLLANDLPGVKAHADIQPSKDTPGASDVVFIIEHHYADGSLSYDNRGSKTSGPREYTVGADVNSALGLYEKTSLNWINTNQTNELRYFSAEHDEVLDSEGTKLALTGNMSHGAPGGTLSQLDTRTRNLTVGATLSHPLIRTRAQSLTVSGGVTSRDSRTDEMSAVQSDDHIRSVNAGLSYDFSDSWDGSNLLSTMLEQGLSGFGSTSDSSTTKTRANGTAQYTKVTFDASRTQQLPQQFSLLAAVTAQYSANTLLSAAQFGYGGSSFGRAYDSSEITGDNGAAAKIELQYTDKAEKLALNYYQPFIFYDYGVTNDRNPVNTDATRTGASAGVGVRFGLTDYLTGSFEFDKPLTRPVAANQPSGKGKDPRAFFSLTARY